MNVEFLERSIDGETHPAEETVTAFMAKETTPQ
jgi:hypothetical protein